MIKKHFIALIVKEFETLVCVGDDGFLEFVQNGKLLYLQQGLLVVAIQQVVLLNVKKIPCGPQKEDQRNDGLDDCQPLLSHLHEQVLPTESRPRENDMGPTDERNKVDQVGCYLGPLGYETQLYGEHQDEDSCNLVDQEELELALFHPESPPLEVQNGEALPQGTQEERRVEQLFLFLAFEQDHTDGRNQPQTP